MLGLDVGLPLGSDVGIEVGAVDGYSAVFGKNLAE